MSDIAIKAENVGKLYRLGQIGTGTLSHDLNRWWAQVRGKEDPFAKIGEANDRTKKGESDYVWALQDVDFEIKKGDAVGIIGRNGAGKSTLLKLLSKVTKPTTGSIKIDGRIASLLEVGTGFHPEMTGRENIYLNGAILGMRKREIDRKFDEIVDFSGVERYIDTPVKRYSSGMYVRLAFAVAAHLESEILIVDEVLAVGDAEFQKKCLGKMGDVSKGEGRTVLFVSHNMASIKQLCSTGLLMENGCVSKCGEIQNVIDNYFSFNKGAKAGKRIEKILKRIYFTKWFIEGSDNFSVKSGASFIVAFELVTEDEIENCELGFVIRNHEGRIVLGCNNRDNGGEYLNILPGTHILKFELTLPVIHGDYELDIAIISKNAILDQWVSDTFLTVTSDFKSVLPERWRGDLNVDTKFFHEVL